MTCYNEPGAFTEKWSEALLYQGDKEAACIEIFSGVVMLLRDTCEILDKLNDSVETISSNLTDIECQLERISNQLEEARE